MTDKELRKLSRAELLEMLIQQIERNEELEAELKKAKTELRNRAITIENAGSLAEAALQINGVFEAAQAAAYFSDERASSNVAVDYTRVKFVKKPSGSAPGHVLYTDYYTAYVNPAKPKG